jgi:hypothetical protein
VPDLQVGAVRPGAAGHRGRGRFARARLGAGLVGMPPADVPGTILADPALTDAACRLVEDLGGERSREREG